MPITFSAINRNSGQCETFCHVDLVMGSRQAEAYADASGKKEKWEFCYPDDMEKRCPDVDAKTGQLKDQIGVKKEDVPLVKPKSGWSSLKPIAKIGIIGGGVTFLAIAAILIAIAVKGKKPPAAPAATV